MLRPPPRSTLFPYTTLFRSGPTYSRLRTNRCRNRAREKRACAPRPSDRKSTRLNSSHVEISYAVFCLKKKTCRTGRSRTASSPTTARPTTCRRTRPTATSSCMSIGRSRPSFSFNATAATEIYTLSLHDALPIWPDVLQIADKPLPEPGAGEARVRAQAIRSEEHTSELQSRRDLVCRLLLEKKNLPHWKVENRVIPYDGKADNLQTDQAYGNFELYVDWKIPPQFFF